MLRLGQYERHIQYLYEAARAGTMRAASEKLNVATSSISRQIAFLEAALGTPLIERGRRSLKLTEAGERLAQYYREKLAHDEAFISDFQHLRGNQAGHISIAVGEGVIGETFLTILGQFSQAHPDVGLSVHVGGTSDVLGLVREDEAHLGMVFHAPPDPRIRATLTLAQPLKVIAHPDMPIARKASVTLDELYGLRLGLPERGFRIRQIIEPVEMQVGEALVPTMITNSLGLLKQYVKSNQGITILTDIVVADELGKKELVAIPLDHKEMASTRTQFITRTGRRLPKPATDLLRTIEINLRALGMTAIRGQDICSS